MLSPFQMPSPPPEPIDRSYPRFRDWLREYSDRVYNYLTQWIAGSQGLVSQFNTLLIGYGSDIASAASITVTNAFHQVTGTAAVSTILQPTGQSAVGPLCLYSRDGFSITTGGNLTPAMSIAAGHTVVLFFSPVLSLWAGVTS